MCSKATETICFGQMNSIKRYEVIKKCTFQFFCMVGDRKTGTRRVKAMIWRAQMALYLMGRVCFNPLMKVMTKGTTNRPSLVKEMHGNV